MLRAQVLADGLWEMDCSQSESARPDLKFRSRLNRTLICISYFVIFADPAKCVCQAVWGSTETAQRQVGGGRRGDAHLPPLPHPREGSRLFSLDNSAAAERQVRTARTGADLPQPRYSEHVWEWGVPTPSMSLCFRAACRPGLGRGMWAQPRGRKWMPAGPGSGTGSGLVGHLFLTS